MGEKVKLDKCKIGQTDKLDKTKNCIKVEIDKKMYNVHCEVYYMSFSAHADAKGILNLIKNTTPKNLVLVHGDHEIMKIFNSLYKIR